MAEQDKDSRMLVAMAHAIAELQVRYRAATLDDQAILMGPLKQAMDDYADYQARLIKPGIVTIDAELAEMQAIQDSITASASRQALLLAIARLVALMPG